MKIRIHKTMTGKLLGIFLIFFVLVFLLEASSVQAAVLPEVRATVNIGATVDSKVSPINSEIELDSPDNEEPAAKAEIVAGSGIKIPVIIKLVDASNNPLVNIKVELRSNRGDIDLIEAVASQNGRNPHPNRGLSLIGRARAADSSRINYTDNEGIARFTVTSDVPGDATFTAFVDNMVLLDHTVEVAFSAPPFPSSVSVSFRLPFTHQDITIFNSQPNETQPNASTSSGAQPSSKASGQPGTTTSPGSTPKTGQTAKLVNTTTDINMPFIVFVILALILLTMLIFPFIIIILLIKVRKTTKKEQDMLNGLCLTRGCPIRAGNQPPQAKT